MVIVKVIVSKKGVQMKIKLTPCLVLLCIISLKASDAPSTRAFEQMQYLPDDVRDSLLLAQGVNILASVGQILVNPHNQESVQTNLSNLLSGINNFVQVLVRKKRAMELQQHCINLPLYEQQKELLRIIEDIAKFQAMQQFLYS